jgi:hypothetical protein
MQPLQPPQRTLPPRPLIARQPIDPTVNVAHKLKPFDIR